MQIQSTATDEDIKKAYRNISRLVHPDKNADDLARAQEAFEAVNQAYKMLTDSEVVNRCKQVIEEAKRRITEQKEKTGTSLSLDCLHIVFACAIITKVLSLLIQLVV